MFFSENTISSIKEKLQKIQLSSFNQFSIELDKFDMLQMFSLSNSQIKYFWRDRKKEFTIVAFGSLQSWKIEEITEEKLQEFANFYILGGTSFFYKHQTQTYWEGYPNSFFFVPQFCFIEQNNCIFLHVYFSKENFSNILSDFRDFSNNFQKIVFSNEKFFVKNISYNPSFEEWKEIVEKTKVEIHQEKIQKAVLSREVKLELSEPLDIATIYYQILQKHYKDKEKKNIEEKNNVNSEHESYLFCFQLNRDNIFLGFSPERLYKRKGREIYTEAIAGCTLRNTNPKKDKILELNLLADSKERLEQKLVHNNIGHQLEQICNHYKKQEDVKVMKLSYVQHLYSSFLGSLKTGIHDLKILSTLHPTPAVAGIPNEYTIEYIMREECHNRGWYASPLGYISKNISEFTVGIRSARIQKNCIYLYSGAGILSQSNSEKEWEELNNKIVPFIEFFKYVTTNQLESTMV